MNYKNIIFALAGLVLIWTGVGAILSATSRHTSTPEKVQSLMAKSPWLDGHDSSEEARRKHLGAIIAQVNMLDFDQRRQMREGRETSQRFFDSLSKEEKARFLEATVEQHFKSVMKAFNKMTPDERRKVVDQARNEMQKNQRDGRDMEKLKAEDEKVFEGVVEKGLSAYYQDASAETKMDLAPLMEEMQQRIRGFRGGGGLK